MSDVAAATKVAVRATASRLFNKQDGPPDLDEVWRDLNRKLSGLFGGKGGGDSSGGRGSSGGFEPSPKNAGIGVALIAGVAVLIWLGSGVFIVQEGQQAAITTFGKFSHLRNAGLQFRWPYPIQSHETVQVTQLRSESIGTNTTVQATGLRDSSMLTQDENIVDIRFTVQYKLKDARAFLYENNRPSQAVIQAAESAVREVVGRSKVDAVLYEQRAALTTDLVKSIQAQLDRVNAGILVDNVNVSNVQVPEQVQAAFDDAFKAGADRDRLKNEGQAYAADVIPKAQGTAARLKQEADAHKSSVVAQAEGDAQRFESVLGAYQKAPAVTRDRMYIETMQQVYSNVSKVMVESKNGSNLLYLPLDKLIQQSGTPAAVPAPVVEPAAVAPVVADPRSRDGARNRDGR
jgi:modulator of FtsH protease HflK